MLGLGSASLEAWPRARPARGAVSRAGIVVVVTVTVIVEKKLLLVRRSAGNRVSGRSRVSRGAHKTGGVARKAKQDIRLRKARRAAQAEEHA